MPVHISYHRISGDSRPEHFGELAMVLGEKIGARQVLAVGTVANGNVQDKPCLARIVATEVCAIEIGVGAVAVGNAAEYWGANTTEVRFIPAGGRVSVILAA